MHHGHFAAELGGTLFRRTVEHYYRFIRNLTRHDGSAFDKAAQFELWEQNLKELRADVP